MRKIKRPDCSWTDVFSECVNGIGPTKKDLKDRCANVSSQLVTLAEAYDTCANKGELFSIKAQKNYAKISDAEWLSLYSQYLVGAKKVARKYYDQIKTSANDFCPYCGLTKSIAEVDHFLPKSEYPIYSTHPSNLVPSCRDCNQGRGAHKWASKETEHLHPYFSEDKFYSEKWLEAAISINYPATKIEDFSFTFSVAKSGNLSCSDLMKLEAHFRVFGLASEFSRQASSFLSELFCSMTRLIGQEERKQFLEDAISDCKRYGVNHWKPAMLTACLKSDEFLKFKFGQDKVEAFVNDL